MTPTQLLIKLDENIIGTMPKYMQTKLKSLDSEQQIGVANTIKSIATVMISMELLERKTSGEQMELVDLLTLLIRTVASLYADSVIMSATLSELIDAYDKEFLKNWSNTHHYEQVDVELISKFAQIREVLRMRSDFMKQGGG